jgi:hypothetical protein
MEQLTVEQIEKILIDSIVADPGSAHGWNVGNVVLVEGKECDGDMEWPNDKNTLTIETKMTLVKDFGRTVVAEKVVLAETISEDNIKGVRKAAAWLRECKKGVIKNGRIQHDKWRGEVLFKDDGTRVLHDFGPKPDWMQAKRVETYAKEPEERVDFDYDSPLGKLASALKKEREATQEKEKALQGIKVLVKRKWDSV